MTTRKYSPLARPGLLRALRHAGGLQTLRRERRLTKPDAGSVEDRVGDGAGGRARGAFAGPARRALRMVDQHDLDRLRRFGHVEDRIALPIRAGDALGVELHLFPQGAARALHDVALDG